MVNDHYYFKGEEHVSDELFYILDLFVLSLIKVLCENNKIIFVILSDYSFSLWFLLILCHEGPHADFT